MRPSGHLITSAVLSAAIYAGSRSVGLAAGAFVGGFLIDLDHYFDYFVFHRQTDLRPSRFLDYYMNNEFQWVVLPLHAYELMAALAAIAIAFPQPWLIGYLAGAAMHLSLNLYFNQPDIGSTIPFYSFVYRAKMGFAKERLIRGQAARI